MIWSHRWMLIWSKFQGFKSSINLSSSRFHQFFRWDKVIGMDRPSRFRIKFIFLLRLCWILSKSFMTKFIFKIWRCMFKNSSEQSIRKFLWFKVFKINQNRTMKTKKTKLLPKQIKTKSKTHIVWIKNSGNVIYLKLRKKLLLYPQSLSKVKDHHQWNKLKEIKTKYYLVFFQNKVTLTLKLTSSFASG